LITKSPEDGSVWNAGEVMKKTGLVLSTVFFADGSKAVVTHATSLLHGARVVAVGSAEQVARGAELLGGFAPEPLRSQTEGFQLRRYMLSNPELGGKNIAEIQRLLEPLGAVLTRLRRGDIDLPIDPQLQVQPGDRVRIVSYPESEPKVGKLVGDSLHVLAESGYLSFALGLFLGILLGQVPIPIPGLERPVTLGVAGGPLVAALILGRLGRTGPIVWSLPLSNNLTLRSFGLILFFAAVGTKAGSGLLAVANLQGAFLVALSCAVLLVTQLLLWSALGWIGVRDPAAKLGYSCGLQTQPAAFTFVTQRLQSPAFSVAYASAYPLATLVKIILAQALVLAA
jgi:putative transport protein